MGVLATTPLEAHPPQAVGYLSLSALTAPPKRGEAWGPPVMGVWREGTPPSHLELPRGLWGLSPSPC